MKEFADDFPFNRLIYAFNTTGGNVHLEFVSKEEADEVFREVEIGVFRWFNKN